MAILHIQLDIDSDVLPELHAVLSAISKNLSRAERLRQLASAGLIWEHLRVHTNATASGVAKSLIGVPLAEAEAALDLPAATEAAPDMPAASEPATRTAARTAPAGGPPPLPRTMFSPAAHTDVPLDLALDLDGALATADNSERPAPRQPAPPRFVPVLHDVVEESVDPVKAPARREGGARSRAAAAREPLAEPVTATAPLLAEPAADLPVDEAPSDAPQDDAPPPARKSGARSRLIRMQEKGLFKNG